MNITINEIGTKEGFFFGIKKTPAKSMLFPTLCCYSKKIFSKENKGKSFSREQEEFIFESSNMILNTYARENRLYHNINHIFSFLEMLQIEEIQRRINDENFIVIASIFHDIDLKNVLASACFAREYVLKIGGGIKQAETVFDLVMDTEHKDFSKTNDGKILADMDLYPLSIPPNEFKQNTELLFKEVQNEKSREDFDKGVVEFLNSLLDRKKIFGSEPFFQFEKPARINLVRYLESFS